MNDVANKRNKLNKLGIKQMKELIDLEKNGKLAEKPIKDVKKLIYNINDQSKDFTPTEVKSDRYKEPSIDEVETILESSNRDVNRLENTVGELLNVSKELLALVRETSHGYLPPIKAATLALNLTDSIIEPKSILNIPSVDISIFTMERTQLNISSIEKGDFEYEELH